MPVKGSGQYMMHSYHVECSLPTHCKHIQARKTNNWQIIYIKNIKKKKKKKKNKLRMNFREKRVRAKLTICSNPHDQFQHIWLGDARAES